MQSYAKEWPKNRIITLLKSKTVLIFMFFEKKGIQVKTVSIIISDGYFFRFRFFADSTASATTGLFSNRLV